MQIVPTRAIPNQTFQVQLGGQACTVDLVQMAYGLFMNLYVGNSLVVAGVICENLNRIVRSAYLGFSGDLCFFDTEGTDDPVYTGLGSRWQLVYLDSSEV